MFKIMSRNVLAILLAVISSSCGFYDGDDKMNLIISCKDGDIEKVKMYIDEVSSPNFISLKGDTPLNAAAHNGHVQVVQYLIENGASCSYKDENGKTAMQVAVETNQAQVISYLRRVSGC